MPPIRTNSTDGRYNSMSEPYLSSKKVTFKEKVEVIANTNGMFPAKEFWFRWLGEEPIKVLVGNHEQCFYIPPMALRCSPVLAAMCDGPFQESKERVIRLPDDDPQHFTAMMAFCYLNIKRKGDDLFDYWDHSSLHNFHCLYLLADKYLFRDLKAAILRHIDTLFQNPKEPIKVFEFYHDLQKDLVISDHELTESFFRVAAKAYRLLEVSERGKVSKMAASGGALAENICNMLMQEFGGDCVDKSSCSPAVKKQKPRR